MQTKAVIPGKTQQSYSWVGARTSGIAGNRKAGALAREGSANTFTGPEPVFGITKTTACRSISAWIKLQHQTYWTNVAGHRQSKLMMGKPSQSLAADVLRLSRTQIRAVTGLMTDHCNLRKHLLTMGIFKENPVCRLCNEKEETTFHIVFECEILAHRQFNLLGFINPGEKIPRRNLVKRLLDFIKGTNLFTQE
jgi:hypothetical protein